MPRQDAPHITRDELVNLLDYDAETGEFKWRADRRPYIKAGDHAGGINGPWNYYVITINGRSYAAHKLAWLYVHGEWPKGAPTFRNYDTADCSIDNLEFAPREYSDTKAAVTARRYRERNKRNAKLRATQSPIADITRNGADNLWRVHIPGTPDNAYTYATKDLDEAIQLYLAHNEGLAAIDRLPPRPVTAADIETFAGDKHAVRLSEVIGWLCYDPDTGNFYHRHRHSRALDPKRHPKAGSHAMIAGSRADTPNTAGSLVVKLFGRDYPAHMMAVFMTLGAWPRRRQVHRKDGNKLNNRWNNLELRA